jgi:hypothetical protein
MFRYFTGERAPEGQSSTLIKAAILLIVVPDKKTDYVALFSGQTLADGRPIEVIQAMWSEFLVAATPTGESGLNCLVHLCGLAGKRTFVPDFLLVRSEVRGVHTTQDYRNSLYGLMYSNVPSVNSLHSIYCFLERPVVQAELNRLASTLGPEVFPVVRQSFFASHREMMYGDTFPAVVKVGHAHAGYGKMKLPDHHMMEDFRTVLALGDSYVTAEPFLDGEYDLRVQYIRGSPLRVFERRSVSGNWKTNTGSSDVQEVPAGEITETHKMWAHHACTLFGGLDICTVDAIHDRKTDKDVIMEVNGTSSGFGPNHSAEDMDALRQLVLHRMNQALTSGYTNPSFGELVL